MKKVWVLLFAFISAYAFSADKETDTTTRARYPRVYKISHQSEKGKNKYLQVTVTKETRIEKEDLYFKLEHVDGENKTSVGSSDVYSLSNFKSIAAKYRRQMYYSIVADGFIAAVGLLFAYDKYRRDEIYTQADSDNNGIIDENEKIKLDQNLREWDNDSPAVKVKKGFSSVQKMIVNSAGIGAGISGVALITNPSLLKWVNPFESKKKVDLLSLLYDGRNHTLKNHTQNVISKWVYGDNFKSIDEYVKFIDQIL